MKYNTVAQEDLRLRQKNEPFAITNKKISVWIDLEFWDLRIENIPEQKHLALIINF